MIAPARAGWPRARRWRHRLATTSPLVLLACAGAWWVPLPQAVLLSVTVLLINACATMHYAHHRVLCEYCLLKVLGLIDPSGTAERRRSLLWIVHFLRRYVLVVVAVAIVVSFWPLNPVASRSINTAIAMVLAVWVFAVAQHNLLMPWCPWCRHHGQDDDPGTWPDPGPGQHRHAAPPAAPGATATRSPRLS